MIELKHQPADKRNMADSLEQSTAAGAVCLPVCVPTPLSPVPQPLVVV